MTGPEDFEGINAQRICAALNVEIEQPDAPLKAKYEERDDGYFISGSSPSKLVTLMLFENGNLEGYVEDYVKGTRTRVVLSPDNTLVSRFNNLTDPEDAPSRPHRMPNQVEDYMRRCSHRVFGAVRSYLDLKL